MKNRNTLRRERRYVRWMWLLTLVYTLVTFLNLGTLRFPQTVWSSRQGGELVIDLGESVYVQSAWFNGNIGTGTLRLTGDDGTLYEYNQVYSEMFSWESKPLGFTTRYITLTPVEGDVRLNEVAFFDEQGVLLAASVAGWAECPLLDEQDTVPEASSYLNGMYFDEIYHARTAYEFLHGMPVYEWTHPPLGKLLIALGVTVFGMTPFGWRAMPALFGAAMLPVLFFLARRLFRREDYAFLAAALFAVDTMHFTQTRIATVDVFVVFFILLMYLFMLGWLRTDFLRAPLKKALVPLGACGVSFGLGVAAKWTGLYAGAGLAVLFFTALIRQGLRAGRDPALRSLFWKRAGVTVLFCCGFFLLIPALIYFLSYFPFYRVAAAEVGGNYGLGDALQTLLQQQESMYYYHSTLTATHLCQSAWYQWPFTAKAVWFYSSSSPETGMVSLISSFGSPAVWWLATVGTLCLAVECAFGRMRGSVTWKDGSVFLVLVGVLANFLPWTLVTRCTFQYHFFPTVPFLLLAALMLLQHLEERGEVPAWSKWAWLGIAAVFFLLLYPAASGLPMARTYAEFLEYVLPGGVLFYGAV